VVLAPTKRVVAQLLVALYMMVVLMVLIIAAILANGLRATNLISAMQFLQILRAHMASQLLVAAKQQKIADHTANCTVAVIAPVLR
jgi:hypothetical protein